MDTLTNPARVLGLTSCLGDLGMINTLSTIISNGCFPTCLVVVGSLDPCLFFFFLIFLFFFFFLSTRLLASEISLGEEDEIEEDLASEEGEEDITSEEGEGST
jgi:hypothetical protein